MGEAEVVADRAVEQHRLLGHQHHLLAQVVDLQVASAVRAIVNGSRLGHINPRDQAHQRAFATSRFTNHRCGDATRDVQAEAIQQLTAAWVVKTDLVAHDVGVVGYDHAVDSRMHLLLRLFGEHLRHTLEHHIGPQELLADGGDPRQEGQHVGSHAVEGEQLADAELLLDDEGAAVPEQGEAGKAAE